MTSGNNSHLVILKAWNAGEARKVAGGSGSFKKQEMRDKRDKRETFLVDLVCLVHLMENVKIVNTVEALMGECVQVSKHLDHWDR